MRIVIQRVSEASVNIDGHQVSSIKKGLLILLGITHEDDAEDIDYLVRKTIQLRIFDDEEGKMNLSLQDIEGEALIVSQFTLHAKTKKRTRPSYTRAASPEQAIPLYEKFVTELKTAIGDQKVSTGEFGAMMQVQLINDGPVTILMDSKEK
ncbi:D-aminoacyl-tRNA deacylase [Parvicella tangerina]|uniref:D-aminoacyl-tRNA deacylase n=1 Tax=Parvicella tangerina TaxID=2829795 RepID=A0A916JL44_9FLAO|nr:D-aminoacyl-tRNA deacylase [Parvicella tangerina]CAG5080386.1 D-aminoacyl-tRNA deacylase [Parvicella tangerina]